MYLLNINNIFQEVTRLTVMGSFISIHTGRSLNQYHVELQLIMLFTKKGSETTDLIKKIGHCKNI